MKENAAKVVKPFKGAPDGTGRVVAFKPGDTITGDLANAMVAAGYATRKGLVREKAAQPAAPENKAKDERFREQDGGDTGERSKPKPRATRPRGKKTG